MEPSFDNTRHLRYWQRCLRTLLPHQYTSNDSTRMTLGCFTVAAIDLLSPSGSPSFLSPTEKRNLRGWVLACQHPSGGFAGSPTHVLPNSAYDGFDFVTGQPAVGAHSTANIAATLFALQLLALLSDNTEGDADGRGASAFAGVNRKATLRWLTLLQRENGSFGEVLATVVDHRVPGGHRTLIAGGSDLRYCYIASMIRWMLRGHVQKGEAEWVEDIDVDSLVRYIRQGQTYDGGFSESSVHESHGGYTFCALAALSLLDRPQEMNTTLTTLSTDGFLSKGISNKSSLIHWLSRRQMPCGSPDSTAEENENNEDDEYEGDMVLEKDAELLQGGISHIGFNGRCNKPADTCYTWWTVGAMANLHYDGMADSKLTRASRRFLLEKMQHIIGGFSKSPGGPPDVYHSYLGLAALATMGEPGLKSFDPAFCISSDTVECIEKARKGLLLGAGRSGMDRKRALLDMGKACWDKTTAC